MTVTPARNIWRVTHATACVAIIACCGCGSGESVRGPDVKSIEAVDEEPVEASGSLRSARPASYTERLSGTTVTFEMVPIPAGRMPDSTGAATIPTDGFWISRTEITWDVYDVFVFGLDGSAGPAETDAVARPSKPYVLPGDDFGHAGLPALGMTAAAADHFAEWLSAKTGHDYYIPTESEWEYACGQATAGAVPGAIDSVAWHRDNSDRRTRPPALKDGGSVGVFDMLGNAGEWVHGRDGSPAVKGGSYLDDPSGLDCTVRRTQTRAWNMTDPQIPKSLWWLSDAPFVTLRVARSWAS